MAEDAVARGEAPRWTRFALPAILALTFLAYLPTLGYDFVFDDQALIVENPALRSWEALPDYFRGHLWSSVFPNRRGHFYRPLLLVFYRCNEAVFGLKAWGWHLSHVLMHVAATALAYFLALRCLGRRGPASIAALVFGLHPIHAEAVAWVAGGNEPFHAVFFLGALLAALRWSERAGRSGAGWLFAALLLYSLALLAKETALVFPLVCGLSAAALSKREEGLGARLIEGVRVGLPFAALAAAMLGLRFLALGQVAGGQAEVPLDAMARTWPALGLWYSSSLVWPVNLAPAYPLGAVESWGSAALPGLAMLALALGLALWSRAAHRRGPLLVALVFLVAPLVPVFNLRALPPGDFVHDRFLYLPSLGFALILGLATREYVSAGSRGLRLVGLGSMLAAVSTLGLVIACRPWRDNASLFARGVASAPRSLVMRNNLATELMAQGRAAEGRAQLEEALEIDPKNWLARYNLGFSFHRSGEAAEAARHLAAAVALDARRSPEAHVLLALNLLRLERLAEAARAVERGLSLNPRGRGFRYVAGLVARARGDEASARRAFRDELRLFPDQAAARAALRAMDSGEGAEKQ